MKKIRKPLTFENRNMLSHVFEKRSKKTIKGTMKSIVGNSSFLFFFILLIFITLPLNGFADDVDNYKFTINGDEVRIDKYIGTETNVTIPDKVVLKDVYKEKEYIVTSIGDKAFRYGDIISVKIPSTVKNIGSYCFEKCTSLVDVSIPTTVNSIGTCAFASCTSLNSIQIPNSITVLNYGLFENCSSLSEIEIPKSVVEIHSGIFKNCSSLTSLIIPESVKKIDLGNIGSLFGGCNNLKSIRILCKDYRLYLDYSSLGFESCPQLEYAYVESFPMDFYNSFFSGSDYLKTVELGSGVNTIRDFTFEGCKNLTTVIIRGSVTSIGSYAFEKCINLTHINLPSGLKTIGNYAFCDCSKLEYINLPNSLDNIGKGSFKNCSSLQSISIPNSVTSIEECAFWGCNNLRHAKLPSRLDKIEESLFHDCWSLSSIIIPKTVTTIGSFAFCYCGLRTINIPNSVRSIGDLAFAYCPLTTITIPQSVESIGSGAFSNCIYLTSYFCHAKQPPSESGLTGKYPNLTVYVPYESIELYKNHKSWESRLLFPQMNFTPKKGYDIDNYGNNTIISGVTADGKSELYVSQHKDCFPNKTDFENISLIIYLNGEECTDEKITGRFSEIGLSNDKSGIWGFTYTAPEDFPESVNENEYLLDVYLVNDINGLLTLVGETQIIVMRPGVMLVHGLNSDASCFAKVEDYLTSIGGYNKYQIRNVNYYASNKATFNRNTHDKNYKVIKNNATILFKQLADNGIVSSSYDMIGHSMGGILIRKYAQEVDDKSVNKIITINTPHSGSPWADEYINMVSRVDKKAANSEGLLGDIWYGVRAFARYKQLTGNWGAIQDLSTSSKAIKELNDPNALARVKDIPVQSLYSTLNMEGAVPQKEISIDPSYSWLYDIFTVGTFLEKDKDGKINDLEILNRLFANEKHDGVVPLNSQRGGLTGKNLSPEGDKYKGAFGLSSYSHHCNITDNPETFSEIHKLLYSPKNSSNFVKGFNPIDLSNKNVRTRASDETVTFKKPSESQFIKIQAEKEDTARVLKVTISGSNDLWTNLIIIDLDEDKLLTGIGQNEYRFRIPDTYEGDLTVYALGRTEDDALVGDSVVVSYEKGASLSYMFFEDWPEITMVEGQQIELNVIGGWSNGEEKYIIPEYSTNKDGIIESDGSLITAKAEGECLLIAKYEGLADTITVKVVAANANSILIIEKNKPSIRYSNGNLEVIPTNGYTGPVKVMIYDMSGNVCYQQHRIVSVANEPIEFDLSSLSTQLYIARVRTSDEHAIKFVKR